MKQKSLTIVAVALLTIAISTAIARAQTTAVGPYYATPSWDQTLPPAQRFIVLSNMNQEAVLDRETGLVWERTPVTNVGVSSQVVGVHSCLGKTTGGKRGWRLPTYPELTSLLDPTIPSSSLQPALPAGHPFNLGLAALFWTSTPQRNSENFYLVNVYDSTNTGTQNQNSPGVRAWCVRSPDNHS